MRSRELALCAALALLQPAVAAPPTPAQVQQAVDTVKRHPDLGGTVTEKSLRWKKTEDRKTETRVGSSRVDLQACKLEYSIVSPK